MLRHPEKADDPNEWNTQKGPNQSRPSVEVKADWKNHIHSIQQHPNRINGVDNDSDIFGL